MKIEHEEIPLWIGLILLVAGLLFLLIGGCSPNVGSESELAIERCIGHGGVREQFKNSVICKNGAAFAYPYRRDHK